VIKKSPTNGKRIPSLMKRKGKSNVSLKENAYSIREIAQEKKKVRMTHKKKTTEEGERERRIICDGGGNSGKKGFFKERIIVKKKRSLRQARNCGR